MKFTEPSNLNYFKLIKGVFTFNLDIINEIQVSDKFNFITVLNFLFVTLIDVILTGFVFFRFHNLSRLNHASLLEIQKNLSNLTYNEQTIAIMIITTCYSLLPLGYAIIFILFVHLLKEDGTYLGIIRLTSFCNLFYIFINLINLEFEFSYFIILDIMEFLIISWFFLCIIFIYKKTFNLTYFQTIVIYFVSMFIFAIIAIAYEQVIFFILRSLFNVVPF